MIENSEHLQWLHNRFVNVYGVDPDTDYLIRLREIIKYEADTEEEKRRYLLSLNRQKAIDKKKKEWKPPFRVGRKKNRTVVDSKGIELVVFPVGAENYAEIFCELLNKTTNDEVENPGLNSNSEFFWKCQQ